MPVLMFGSWVVNEIWIIDPRHRSFFSLDWYVNEFIQFFFSFFERSSFKLRCETVIGIVLCCSHQACCLLYYLGEIYSGIHMYQFTFEPLHFCFRMWLWFRVWQKFWRIDGFGGKKARICEFALIPLFTPLVKVENINRDCKRRT